MGQKPVISTFLRRMNAMLTCWEEWPVLTNSSWMSGALTLKMWAPKATTSTASLLKDCQTCHFFRNRLRLLPQIKAWSVSRKHQSFGCFPSSKPGSNSKLHPLTQTKVYWVFCLSESTTCYQMIHRSKPASNSTLHTVVEISWAKIRKV